MFCYGLVMGVFTLELRGMSNDNEVAIRDLVERFQEEDKNSPEYTELSGFLSSISHINGKNSNGETLLHYAGKWGKIALAQELLQRGANPLIKDETGKNFLHTSVFEERNDFVKFFIEDSLKKAALQATEAIIPDDAILDLNATDDYAMNYLQCVALKGNRELVAYFIKL